MPGKKLQTAALWPYSNVYICVCTHTWAVAYVIFTGTHIHAFKIFHMKEKTWGLIIKVALTKPEELFVCLFSW